MKVKLTFKGESILFPIYLHIIIHSLLFYFMLHTYTTEEMNKNVKSLSFESDHEIYKISYCN